MEELYREIEIFSKWAETNYPEWSENNDNGEWEMGLNSHYYEMCDAAVNVINEYESNKADEKTIDSLLFVVARDNECEIIVEKLTLHKDWYELLAKKSIGSKYVNAEWQFAKHLGECKECDQNLIFAFIESDYEYTSRMALNTMAELKPECAEEYAIRFWNRGKYPEGSYEDEYQKIMALTVLAKIKSKKVNEYLDKARILNYKWLIENAEKIVQSIE